MAGKIVADQLEHSTAGSLDTQFVVNGSAKAFNNIDGSSGTPTSQNSLNNGSITDNGTGDYSLSFTSSFNNANYVQVGMGGESNLALRTPHQQKADHAPTTSACRYQMIYQNGQAAQDIKYFGVANFGDLA